MTQPCDTTECLIASLGGDRAATEELVRLLYDELHALSARLMGRERADHTLQPTALVHETYLRMIHQGEVDWRDRAHFFSAASRIIRQILVDHARRHGAAKRGGGWERVELRDEDESRHVEEVDLVALDAALHQLEELNPRQRHIVELRFFGGLTIEETAATLRLSLSTVNAEWALARAWLSRQLAS